MEQPSGFGGASSFAAAPSSFAAASAAFGDEKTPGGGGAGDNVLQGADGSTYRVILPVADGNRARRKVWQQAMFVVFELLYRAAGLGGLTRMFVRATTARLDALTAVSIFAAATSSLALAVFLVRSIRTNWSRVQHGLKVDKENVAAFRRRRDGRTPVGMLEHRMQVLRERMAMNRAVAASGALGDLPMLAAILRWLLYSDAYLDHAFARCVVDGGQPVNCVDDSVALFTYVALVMLLSMFKLGTLRDNTTTKVSLHDLEHKYTASARFDRSFLATLKKGEVETNEVEAALDLVARWPDFFAFEDPQQIADVRALWAVRRAGDVPLAQLVWAKELHLSRHSAFRRRAAIIAGNCSVLDLPGADPWAAALGVRRPSARTWRPSAHSKQSRGALVVPLVPCKAKCSAALASSAGPDKLAEFCTALAEWVLLVLEVHVRKALKMIEVALVVDARGLPQGDQLRRLLETCGPCLPAATAYPFPVKLVLVNAPQDTPVAEFSRTAPIVSEVHVARSRDEMALLVPLKTVPDGFFSVASEEAAAAMVADAGKRRLWDMLKIKEASALTFFRGVTRDEHESAHEALRLLAQAQDELRRELDRGIQLEEIIKRLSIVAMSMTMALDAEEDMHPVALKTASGKNSSVSAELKLALAELVRDGRWPQEEPDWVAGRLAMLMVLRKASQNPTQAAMAMINLLARRLTIVEDPAGMQELCARLSEGKLALSDLPHFDALSSLWHVNIGTIDYRRGIIALILTDADETTDLERASAPAALQEPRVVTALAEVTEYLTCLADKLSFKHRRIFNVRVCHRAKSVFNGRARRARLRIQRAWCRTLSLHPGLVFAMPVLFVDESHVFLETYRALYRLPGTLLGRKAAQQAAQAAESAVVADTHLLQGGRPVTVPLLAPRPVSFTDRHMMSGLGALISPFPPPASWQHMRLLAMPMYKLLDQLSLETAVHVAASRPTCAKKKVPTLRRISTSTSLHDAAAKRASYAKPLMLD